MQNEELTITAGDDHPATQNAYSIHQTKPEVFKYNQTRRIS